MSWCLSCFKISYSTDLRMTSKIEDTKTESEDEIEKDLEANEMLDLDAFF